MNEPSVLCLNYNQLNILEPLTKWRILDLSSISHEINYLHTRDNLCKTVRRLENFGLIHSFKDPFTHRKFIYLTKSGESLINPPGVTSGIARETVFHDAKVTEILREFTKKECFHDATIEHRLTSSEDFQRPDGMIRGEFLNPFKMAFELELTQKSKTRITKRFKYYLESQAYEYVFYLFPRLNVLKTYLQVLTDNFPTEAQKKIILCYNETILGSRFEIDKGVVFFKGDQRSFNEYF